MRVVALLVDAPDAASGVGLGGQVEVGLGDQVDDFVVRQKIARVEVDASCPLPDDDLAHGEAAHDVGAILQKAVLNPPLVVVEDRSVRAQQAHHLGEALTLPGHIDVMGHAIVVAGVAGLQGGFRPLAAVAVLQSVSGAVLDVVRRRSDDQANRLVSHALHDL